MSSSERKRLPSEQARRKILETAHEFFLEGGVDAVKVQKIARKLGITDAAIHYHFKNREKLLESLLTYGGQKLKDVTSAEQTIDLSTLSSRLIDIYDNQQFARLAMWLSLAGWRSDKDGLFSTLAKDWQQTFGLSPTEAKYQIAFINLVLAAESLLGGAFLRSVALSDNDAGRRRFRRWIVSKLELIL